MTTVNMSFGRQAYMTLLTVFFCLDFYDNFVPDKLPKLYKIFVQKQSIDMYGEIYVHVIYFIYNA